MKATFRAHWQGGLWQDHCDKSGTVTSVTEVREDCEVPEMLDGIFGGKR